MLEFHSDILEELGFIRSWSV